MDLYERLFGMFHGFYLSPDDGGGGAADDPPADPPAGDGEGGDPPGGDEEKPDEGLVKSLRDENAKARRKLRELEAKLQKLEERDLSEAEKKARDLQAAQEKATQAETRYRAKALQAEVAMQAGPLEIVDPEAALLFIQRQVEFDEEGEPQNVAALLKDLVKQKPYLVKAKEKPGTLPPAGGRDPGAGRGKAEPSDAERQAHAQHTALRF